MRLVEKPLPSSVKIKQYQKILAEFDASGMKSAKVELGPRDAKPSSAWHGFRKYVQRHPEYSHIGISFSKGEVYLYRKE